VAQDLELKRDECKVKVRSWLQALPDLFHTEVLERLEPPARASLARAGRVWRDKVYPAAIFPSGPPRAAGVRVGRVCVAELLATALDAI